jgi:hypothetical protein
MTSNQSTSLYSALLTASALIAALLAVPAHGLTRTECKLIGSTTHETGSEGGQPDVWTCCANGNQNCVDCRGESEGNCVDRPGPVTRGLTSPRTQPTLPGSKPPKPSTGTPKPGQTQTKPLPK